MHIPYTYLVPRTCYVRPVYVPRTCHALLTCYSTHVQYCICALHRRCPRLLLLVGDFYDLKRIGAVRVHIPSTGASY